MTPKDWIVYIDPKNETRAVLDRHEFRQRIDIEGEGNKIIGIVSSGREADAVAYGEQVLR